MLVKAQGSLLTGRAAEGGSAHPSTWEVSISSVPPASSQGSQACPPQRAEAFGYQLAEMVQVAFRKNHTRVRHQRWLPQRGGGI